MYTCENCLGTYSRLCLCCIWYTAKNSSDSLCWRVLKLTKAMHMQRRPPVRQFLIYSAFIRVLLKIIMYERFFHPWLWVCWLKVRVRVCTWLLNDWLWSRSHLRAHCCTRTDALLYILISDVIISQRCALNCASISFYALNISCAVAQFCCPMWCCLGRLRRRHLPVSERVGRRHLSAGRKWKIASSVKSAAAFTFHPRVLLDFTLRQLEVFLLSLSRLLGNVRRAAAHVVWILFFFVL